MGSFQALKALRQEMEALEKKSGLRQHELLPQFLACQPVLQIVYVPVRSLGSQVLKIK